MKFPTILSLSILAITPALACLETYGAVDVSGNFEDGGSIDNGEQTCDSNWGWRVDQDGHFSLTCLAGYVYAFTTDGSFGWYANPVSAFSFTQERSGEGETWSWNEFRYGC